MKIQGECHCGSIAYEATVDPERVGVCHCTDCQVFSSSAFRVGVPALPGAFRLTSGQPRIYIKTGESGGKRQQAFCSSCGTAIYTTAEPATDPQIFTIRLGTVRERAKLVPKRQIWCRSELPWLPNLASIPQSPKG